MDVSQATSASAVKKPVSSKWTVYHEHYHVDYVDLETLYIVSIPIMCKASFRQSARCLRLLQWLRWSRKPLYSAENITFLLAFYLA